MENKLNQFVDQSRNSPDVTKELDKALQPFSKIVQTLKESNLINLLFFVCF